MVEAHMVDQPAKLIARQHYIFLSFVKCFIVNELQVLIWRNKNLLGEHYEKDCPQKFKHIWSISLQIWFFLIDRFCHLPNALRSFNRMNYKLSLSTAIEWMVSVAWAVSRKVWCTWMKYEPHTWCKKIAKHSVNWQVVLHFMHLHASLVLEHNGRLVSLEDDKVNDLSIANGSTLSVVVSNLQYCKFWM